MKSLILHDDEVRALRDTGEVVVVRRMKPQPPEGHWWTETPTEIALAVRQYPGNGGRRGCPIGRPGERRWVKECACNKFDIDGDMAEVCAYRADVPKDQWHEYDYHFSAFEAEWCPAGSTGWRPAARMLKVDSRLTAECASVTVQRREGVWEWHATYRRIEQ